MIGSQALEIPDGYRLIHVTTPARILAPVRADPPEHPGQGKIFHDDLEGLFILALFHHLHISLHIQPGGAGQAAGGRVCLVDGKCAGNGLCVFFVCCLSVAQTLVVFIGQHNRAYIGTVAAGSAFGDINIARVLLDGYLEISLGTFNLLYIRTGDQVDV